MQNVSLSWLWHSERQMYCWGQYPWVFFVSLAVTLDSTETPFAKTPFSWFLNFEDEISGRAPGAFAGLFRQEPQEQFKYFFFGPVYVEGGGVFVENRKHHSSSFCSSQMVQEAYFQTKNVNSSQGKLANLSS